MKKFEAPVIEELNINETAAGGTVRTEHDDKVYQLDNGLWVEEYAAISGQPIER